MSRRLRDLPEPPIGTDPELRAYFRTLTAALRDMDNGGKRRFVSVEELEEAGIARLINGKLVKL